MGREGRERRFVCIGRIKRWFESGGPVFTAFAIPWAGVGMLCWQIW